MKDFFKFLITSLLIACLMLAGTFYGIIMEQKDTFHSAYVSLLQDKYDMLMATNEPKIVIVAGSSSAFGINAPMLEEATGYKVCNMALHAGFGPWFYTEVSMSNINEGDIVLLAYENLWQSNFKDIDQTMCMSAIDNHIEMYSHLSPDLIRQLVGNMFYYADTKANYTGDEISPYYCREAFDPVTLQMTVQRDGAFDANIYGVAGPELFPTEISQESIDYLRSLKALVESKGASVYFILPPITRTGVGVDETFLNNLMADEERLIGIPCISDPADYFFPDEWMLDSMYHCNSYGEIMRTERLIADLRRGAGI